MPVFRVEKNKSYTVMSNHHLRNRTLSLKAKGLLSQMLSLPEDWDYTLTGLASINRESKDAIRSAVKELEEAGYVVRRQTTDRKGKFGSNEYVIYESPQNELPLDAKSPSAPAKQGKASVSPKLPSSPLLDYPLSENPTTGKPSTENPLSENPTQLNTKEPSTELLSTDVTNNPSYPISSYPSDRQSNGRKRKEADEIDMDACREDIKAQISFDLLSEGNPSDQAKLEEILELMTEIQCSNQSTLRIAGNTYPATLVKERFRSLNSLHMEYVLSCLNDNTTYVRNIKQYLLTTLFNAPATINHYYASQVNHDRQMALTSQYADLFL
jgi:hypothetical protein